MKKLTAWLIKSPIRFFIAALLLVLPLIFVLDLFWLKEAGGLGGVLVEAHGLIFDLLVFGIILALYEHYRQRHENAKKTEIEKQQRIVRYREEIEDFQGWKDQEAGFRIAGNIKRLNKEGVSFEKLSKCYLVRADLTEVNLANADLTKANLRKANLYKANLNKADLSHAKLSHAKLSNIALPYANLFDTKLLWVNLSYADLSHANLYHADLTRANLTNADLSHTVLSHAKLPYAKLTCTKLAHAKLFNSNLNRANLSYSDLSHADLTEADLSEADLSGANFSGASIINANLTGANLSRANLSGLIFKDVNGLSIEMLMSCSTLYEVKGIPENMMITLKQENLRLFEKPKDS